MISKNFYQHWRLRALRRLCGQFERQSNEPVTKLQPEDSTSDVPLLSIEDGASNEELVKAKNIKVGDCLRTVHGDKLVSSTRLLGAAEAAEHETYTVVTAGGSADWIVVGGLLARATDAKKVGMM